MRYARAYYYCRRGGPGRFPFDDPAGRSARQLTPALERIVARAGTVADSVAKAADRAHEMAGARLGESTVERTTADAGQRLAQQLQAGQTFGPQGVWPWPKDSKGRPCASIAKAAPGVRQQGPGGATAAGRLADVGMVCHPAPAWRWPDDQRTPLPARYVAGLYSLEEVGPLLRRQAAPGGMAQAACWLGRTDGGNGREGRLEENFPLVWAVLLDCYHPAAKLFGRARLLAARAEVRAEAQGRDWRRLLKEEGGALLAAVLREWDWPTARPGLSEAVAAVVGHLERHAHRMAYPEYWAAGWCIGSGAVGGACKRVVGQRLKLAGMRGGEDGADAVGPLRALSRSAKGPWEAFWNRAYTN